QECQREGEDRAEDTGYARRFGGGSAFGSSGAHRRRVSGECEGRQGCQHAERKCLAWIRTLESPFDKREHLLMQQLAAARQALFHCVFGQFKGFGHALDGLMLAVKKNERLSVSLRNLRQRAPKD